MFQKYMTTKLGLRTPVSPFRDELVYGIAQTCLQRKGVPSVVGRSVLAFLV